MWSPKKKKNGDNNEFYNNMTRVKPGDIVFSFFGTRISHIGVITSQGYEQAKPEFGSVGEEWGSDGWMVNVDYHELTNKIRPKDHIETLRSLLPEKYSPLQRNGKGIQNVYLASIPEQLAKRLLELIGTDALKVVSEGKEYQGKVKNDREAEEDRIQRLIQRNQEITETEKETLVMARKGQGKFRDDVLILHGACPFTGVSNSQFLSAGHLKPWSRCQNNEERLDPLNGLPLTPVADKLVDQGYATFDSEGRAIFSSLLKPDDAAAMGIAVNKEYRIKILDPRQEQYLHYHRTVVFKK